MADIKTQNILNIRSATKTSRLNRSITPINRNKDTSVTYLNSLLTKYSFEPLPMSSPAPPITLGKFNEFYRIIDSSSPSKNYVELTCRASNVLPKFDPEIVSQTSRGNTTLKKARNRLIMKKDIRVNNNLGYLYDKTYKN